MDWLSFDFVLCLRRPNSFGLFSVLFDLVANSSIYWFVVHYLERSKILETRSSIKIQSPTLSWIASDWWVQMLPIWDLLSMKFAVLASFVYHSTFLCSGGIGSRNHCEIKSSEQPHSNPAPSATYLLLFARSASLWVFVAFVRNWRQYFESGYLWTIYVQPKNRSGQSIGTETCLVSVF